MNQTFDLKNIGFAEMQAEELEVVDGGKDLVMGPIIIPIGTGPTYPTPPVL